MAVVPGELLLSRPRRPQEAALLGKIHDLGGVIANSHVVALFRPSRAETLPVHHRAAEASRTVSTLERTGLVSRIGREATITLTSEGAIQAEAQLGSELADKAVAALLTLPIGEESKGVRGVVNSLRKDAKLTHESTYGEADKRVFSAVNSLQENGLVVFSRQENGRKAIELTEDGVQSAVLDGLDREFKVPTQGEDNWYAPKNLSSL